MREELMLARKSGIFFGLIELALNIWHHVLLQIKDARRYDTVENAGCGGRPL